MYYFLYDNHDPKNMAILSENEYDRDICDNCGGIHITYKGNFNFKIMGKLLDFYVASATPVISERFLNVLRENGYTGFEATETTPRYGTVTIVGDPIKDKYYRLTVTGRCGPICCYRSLYLSSRSERILSCRESFCQGADTLFCQDDHSICQGRMLLKKQQR